MEYCGGGSLADIIYLLGLTITEKQLQVIMKSALQGLAYLHGRRKIHRDIKAGNLLLTLNGECKLGKLVHYTRRSSYLTINCLVYLTINCLVLCMI
jgi:serine/threonine protein kinase